LFYLKNKQCPRGGIGTESYLIEALLKEYYG
jgi:hypothetical protein